MRHAEGATNELKAIMHALLVLSSHVFMPKLCHADPATHSLTGTILSMHHVGSSTSAQGWNDGHLVSVFEGCLFPLPNILLVQRKHARLHHTRQLRIFLYELLEQVFCCRSRCEVELVFCTSSDFSTLGKEQDLYFVPMLRHLYQRFAAQFYGFECNKLA